MSRDSTTLRDLPWRDPVFAAATTDPRWANRRADNNWQDDPDLRRRNIGIMAGSALAVGIYGKTHWWQDGFHTSFRRVDEGWFGKNTYSGGADKLGHFYSNYASARLFTRAFEWAGNTPEDSLKLGTWMALGTFAAAETLDGFSKEWSFSKEDAIINVAGVGAAYLLESKPELDRLIDLRLHYWPSHGSSFNPFGDYSGQTYLFVVKARGLPALREHSFLRYFELALGYGTRGYSESLAKREIGSRYVYAGISLNLSEVLDQTVFRRSASAQRAQGVTDTFLEFVQVPGTAALARHKLRAD
ncbi:MAG TPA: DUF2279 domain-containing protein [Noviherbaspirillum sp.]|nr:DUF2279 domain-containing protein [Noviherbaspirillum sp.]